MVIAASALLSKAVFFTTRGETVRSEWNAAILILLCRVALKRVVRLAPHRLIPT